LQTQLQLLFSHSWHGILTNIVKYLLPSWAICAARNIFQNFQAKIFYLLKKVIYFIHHCSNCPDSESPRHHCSKCPDRECPDSESTSSFYSKKEM